MGSGAKALSFEHGQLVEREPYDLLLGQRKAPDGTPLGRPPGRTPPTSIPTSSQNRITVNADGGAVTID